MKRASIVLAVAVIAFLASCGSKDKRKSFSDPVDYNDYIVDVIDNVTEAWTESVEEDDMDRALAWSDTLANRSQNGIAKLTNLQPFKKDSAFRDAGIKYMQHMNKVANNELKDFIKNNLTEDVTEATIQKVEDLLPILNDDREKLFDDIERAQSNFASKYNIKIGR